MDPELKTLEKRWQDNTIAATTKYCEGIAKIAGVLSNELETAPNSICERYKAGVENKAVKWATNYIKALLEGTTEEVHKE